MFIVTLQDQLQSEAPSVVVMFHLQLHQVVLSNHPLSLPAILMGLALRCAQKFAKAILEILTVAQQATVLLLVFRDVSLQPQSGVRLSSKPNVVILLVTH